MNAQETHTAKKQERCRMCPDGQERRLRGGSLPYVDRSSVLEGSSQVRVATPPWVPVSG